jgi:RNA polymerase sigma factor (sigma-70 family)
MKQASVYLVDDDVNTLQFLETVMARAGFDVRAYACPLTMLQQYDPSPVGCLVLDLWLPHMNGLQLNDKIREKGGKHPFIIITGDADIKIAIDAMLRGAVDFFEKPLNQQALLSAIRSAVQLDEQQREQQRQQKIIEQRIATLTDREKEVLDLFLTGTSTVQVADALAISAKTVYVHRSHIFTKMHVSSLGELIKATK